MFVQFCFCLWCFCFVMVYLLLFNKTWFFAQSDCCVHLLVLPSHFHLQYQYTFETPPALLSPDSTILSMTSYYYLHFKWFWTWNHCAELCHKDMLYKLKPWSIGLIIECDTYMSIYLTVKLKGKFVTKSVAMGSISCSVINCLEQFLAGTLGVVTSAKYSTLGFNIFYWYAVDTLTESCQLFIAFGHVSLPVFMFY